MRKEVENEYYDRKQVKNLKFVKVSAAIFIVAVSVLIGVSFFI